MTGVESSPRFTGAVPVECTVPETELRHYINDSELEQLGEMKRDHLTEVLWASIGAAASGLVPTIQAIRAFNDPTKGMAGSDLFVCVYTGIAVAVALLAWALVRQRSKGRDDLLSQIRGRPKLKIGT